MQNIDGILQYQTNTQTAGASSAAGRAEAVSKEPGLQQMEAGKVFEGTVTENKNGQVVISLTNGQTLYARLETGVSLMPGQPMLFEVKSVSGGQISIRPVPVESAQNPTLLKALTMAGIKVSERSLSMVNLMMKQQMPIDKDSLRQMVRVIGGFPETAVETLVQMKKLQLNIQDTTIGQFENYKSSHHSLVDQFQQIMDKLPEFGKSNAANPKEMAALQQQILDILEIGSKADTQAKMTDLNNGVTGSPQDGTVSQNGSAFPQTALSAFDSNSTAQVGSLAAAINPHPEAEAGTAAKVIEEPLMAGAEAQKPALEGSHAPTAGTAPQTGANSQQVDTVLSPKQLENLESQLRQIPGMEENPAIFKEGRLNPAAAPQEILAAVQNSLRQPSQFPAEAFQKLFSGKEYKSLLKHVMERQWLITPEDVASEKSMERLYERISRQMERLEAVAQDAGRQGAGIEKSVSNIRSNLEFMNQVNQLYQYIQIPLKLHQQNAHSDLYVYANKKNLHDKDGELTALLHLDLEHLGTTDIRIKMLGNQVSADFYLNDSISIRLIEGHLDGLQEKLEQKGYQCSIKLEKSQESINPVDEFLKNEKTEGGLHRYSFDVLA